MGGSIHLEGKDWFTEAEAAECCDAVCPHWPIRCDQKLAMLGSAPSVRREGPRTQDANPTFA